MGSLKPGATYIRERVGNVVYRREFGADPMTREVEGWDYDKENPNYDKSNPIYDKSNPHYDKSNPRCDKSKLK